MTTPTGSRSHDAPSPVRLTGAVDAFSAPSVRSTLRRAVPQADGRVIVDVSQVGFIDSSGLGLLVAAARSLREQGGRLVLLAPDRGFRQLLTMTGLDRVLAVHDAVPPAPVPRIPAS